MGSDRRNCNGTRWATKRLSRNLRIEALESRYLLATVTWDGSGDGDGDGFRWLDPQNWDNDVLPGPSDTVVIDAGNVLSSVLLDGSAQTQHLTSSADFELSGDLTLTGVGDITGDFIMGPGASLTAEGAAAAVSADAVLDTDGGNLFAVDGGSIVLHGELSYNHAPTAAFQTRTWRATGADSQISLPNLKTITNGQVNNNSHMVMEAFGGGQIDLPQVTQIADPTTANNGNEFRLTADGIASHINLPSFTQFLDRGTDLSTISSTNGAQIHAPLLGVATGTHLVLDNTGAFFTDQLSVITDSQLTLSGANTAGDEYVFTSLVDISRTTLVVDGVDVDVDAVVSADGASVLVSGGVTLALPGVTDYNHAATAAFQTRTWRATGLGSQVSLPNLRTITNGQVNNNSHMVMEAFGGGQIDLPQVTQIADPTTANNGNEFQLTADGIGSLINLPSVTQFLDRGTDLSSISVQAEAEVVFSVPTSALLERTSVTLVNGMINGSLELTESSLLMGSGEISGDLTSSVQITPTGTITVGGNYHQQLAGVLNIEIHGAQSDQVDQLIVTGHADLGGQLVVDSSAYSPVVGNTYPVVRFGTRQDDFDLTIGLDLGGLNELRPVYGPTLLTLAAVSTSGVGVFVDSGQNLTNVDPLDSQGVVLGDIDNDGDLDALVTSNGGGHRRPIWLNDGNGVFTSGGAFSTIFNATSGTFGDLDLDGDLDIVIGSQPSRLYLNQGGLQGGTLGEFVTGQSLGNVDTQDVELADLDSDGDLDVFLANANGGDTVWINQGGVQAGVPGQFLDSGQVLGNETGVDVALGDLDGDGHVDAVAVDAFGATYWRNVGTGNFALWLSSSNRDFVELGDIDADGDLDAISIRIFGNVGNSVYRTGAFTVTAEIPFTSTRSESVALGDVDGDGDLDVFGANAANEPNLLWFNDGSGNFSDSGQQLGSANSNDVALGDLDGDGDLDAFIANNGPNKVWMNQALVDHGDAPDLTYPTLKSNAGATHVIIPGFHLGADVDADADGMPHPFALGDDLDGVSDEDGVVFHDTLFVGVANGIDVSASAPGMLDAWIDFNADGDWDDSGEQVFVSVGLNPGLNTLDFVVPSSATASLATFARFRFSSAGGLSPRGVASDGEVEDYFVPIQELDLGDAPSNYPTTLANDGARHAIVESYFLGSSVDQDADGQPDGAAQGDNTNGIDDEDGIEFLTELREGELASIAVDVSQAGMLDAWFDFNIDGDWDDSGEQVFTNHLLSAGTTMLDVFVPEDAIAGINFARFRFSSIGGLAPTGFAPNGEVEDYAIQVLPDGDFNEDSTYDGLDIDALVAAIASDTHPLAFDLSGDGLVDLADRDAWLAEAGAVNLPSGNAYLLGDANLDGAVDADDFLVWNANKFTAAAAWTLGDFDADGLVGGRDFLIWNANKFSSSDDLAPQHLQKKPVGSWSGALDLLMARSKRRDYVELAESECQFQLTDVVEILAHSAAKLAVVS